MRTRGLVIGSALLAATLVGRAAPRQAPVAVDGNERLDLRAATIVVRPAAGPGERLAAEVLREEVQKRTGLDWPVATVWPATGAVVAIDTAAAPAWGRGRPQPSKPPRLDAYAISARTDGVRPVVWITGGDRRGAFYGVGALLRGLAWGPRQATFAVGDTAAAPRYAIRGHQLGYRHHSNTYDAWTAAQFDQYIRELALLGANAVENIPFQDTRPAPLMPVSRDVMGRLISEICAKYDQEYWLWTPADFDLKDAARRDAALAALDRLFGAVPRLDAIFIPGGDPGDNPAQLVVPYLADIAGRLRVRHPGAKMWLSLQHFDRSEVEFLYQWLERERPTWLGGLVAGPSSYPLPEIRARLDRRYGLRDYPDVTHTVRSQYPVPWWDPAYNFTLGREPINPRPAFYAALHDRVAPPTDGFITYSDGVNDDLNKVVWTRKAWQPDADPRTIVLDYARFFFGAAVAERAADGLLALERNWEGPLARNGAVTATLALWQEMEAAAPELAGNWRWQMHLLRAYYDAYTRDRLRYEGDLEREANAVLAAAPRLGAAKAMDEAAAVLARTERPGCCGAWRRRIEALCDALFASIRMQTSVAKHQASGYERGAVLDFVDHPLNNRWWLEDEFAKIKAMPDEGARLARLETLRTWADPGPGGFYDDVGHVDAAPHVQPQGVWGGGREPGDASPHFTWKGGPTRERLSWLTSQRWPKAIVYEDLDRGGRYVVRLNVMTDKTPGTVRLRIDGTPAAPVAEPTERGVPRDYPVPAAAVADGRIELTFDAVDESAVNWRQYSRLVEAWLIKPAAAAAPDVSR